MTTKELRDTVGEYSGLILYPTNEEQEEAKLPFSNPNLVHQYAHKNINVKERRIKAIIDNCDVTIDELKKQITALRKIKQELNKHLSP